MSYTEIAEGIFVKVEKKTGKELHCHSKKVYKNFNEATIAAYNTSKKINESLSAYKCNWCSCYHIGHDYSDAEGKLLSCPNGCGKEVYKSRLYDHLDNCITV